MALQVGELFAVLSADDGPFRQAIDSAEKAFKDVGKQMTDIGKGLTKSVTAPIVGLGTAAVMTVAKFDDSMSQVQAISGATGDELEALRKTAKDMGATTRYAASEAADALTYLALAGWDSEKSIAALPKVLNLAQAGGLDLAYASDLVTDSMSALGMEFGELDGFIDKMAKTSQKSNTSISQLGEGILTVGGTAKVLAGGTTELSTALGILADNGIKGAEGGTTLRNVILSLTAPTDKAAARMKELGIEVADAQGNMRPLNEVFKDFDQVLGDMSATQKTQVLNEIFNKVDLKGVNALLANTGDRFDELSGYIANSEGAAEDMATTMEDNVAGGFRALKSQMEGILIQLGEQLTPIIRSSIIPAVQKLGNIISSLIDRFSKLDPKLQNMILAGIGIAAAIGPLLIVLGTLVSSIGSIISVLGPLSGAFAALTGPVGLTVLAIAAVVAGIVTLYNTNEEFRERVLEVWEYIKELATSVWNSVAETIMTAWETIRESVFTTLENIQEIITGALEFMMQIITDVLDSILTFWNTWGAGIFESIVEALTKVWEWVSYIFNELLKPLWDEALTWLTKIWNDNLKGLVDEMMGFVGRVTQLALDFYNNVIAPIVGWLLKILVPIFKEAFKIAMDIFGTFFNGVAGLVKGLFTIFNGLIDFLTGVFTGDWGKAWEGVKEVFKGIVDSLSSIFKIPINVIITGINSFLRGINKIKIPDWVPGVGGKGFSIPEIPMLAKGGIVDRPTLAMIGEGVESEAVAPLSKLYGMIQDAVQSVTNQVSFAGIFEGAVINVRSDNDIKAIARELYNLQVRNERGKGL